MSDELNSQVSAFIDDELSPEESELFVRRLCRDETLRHTAACYGIIGDVLRGEIAVAAPSVFASGVMMAVEGQSVPVVPAPAVQVRRPMRHWGVAAAASVALAAIALMTLPSRGPDGLDTVIADSTESAAGRPGVNAEAPAPALADSREASTPVSDQNRQPAPLAVTANGPGNRANQEFRSRVVESFPELATNDYNVPIIIPATAENRARLNNLLLQHLYSSGATRQPVGLRNVGFVTQTEAQH